MFVILITTVISITFGYFDIFSWNLQIFLLTYLLVFYNIFELFVLGISKKSSLPYFINPIVLTTLILFFIFLGGITNLFLEKDGHLFTSDIFFLKQDKWVCKAMGLINLSCVSMWLGYKSNFGVKICKFYLKSYKLILSFNVDLYKLIILCFIAYFIKFILFYQGQFGNQILLYSSNVDPSRLKTFEELSKLSFIVITFIFFSDKRNILISILFYLSLVLEIYFALIFGARGPIVFIFILVFIIRYYYFPKFSLSILIGFLVLLYGAFTIVQSYKNYLLSDSKNAGKTITELYNGYSSFTKGSKKSNINDILYYTALGRLNYVNETGMAIRYADEHGLDESDPNLLKQFIFSPLYAFIPQYFILGQKPTDLGRWFNYKIKGDTLYTKVSIAFSPVGYLYLMGGVFSIIFIFFGFGILLKFTVFFITSNAKVSGFIIYLALLSKLVLFDTNVGGVILNIFRYLFLLPLALYLILGKYRA